MAIKPTPAPRPAKKKAGQQFLPVTPKTKSTSVPIPADVRKTARQKSMQKYF